MYPKLMLLKLGTCLHLLLLWIIIVEINKSEVWNGLLGHRMLDKLYSGYNYSSELFEKLLMVMSMNNTILFNIHD